MRPLEESLHGVDEVELHSGNVDEPLLTQVLPFHIYSADAHLNLHIPAVSLYVEVFAGCHEEPFHV